jgi:hypothetical protein
MFYQTGVPFRFADSTSLKEFIKTLRPVYSPPTAKQIAGSLLNKAHSKLMENLTVQLGDLKPVHLVSDGWSSLRKIIM